MTSEGRFPSGDQYPKRCQCDRNGVRCSGLIHARGEVLCPDCRDKCAVIAPARVLP